MNGLEEVEKSKVLSGQAAVCSPTSGRLNISTLDEGSLYLIANVLFS